MPYLRTRRGRKIYYRVKGEGRPLLLLHGLAENSSHFCKQEDFFAKYGYKVIAFDAAGHGKSDCLEDKLDAIDTWLCDLSNVMNYFNISKENPCALVGHSLGGALALCAGFKLPEKIAAIGVLDSSYTFYESISKLIYWKFYTFGLKLLTNSNFLNSMYRNLLRKIYLKPDMSEEEKKETLQAVYHENYKTTLNEIKSVERYRNGVLAEKLKDIKVPTFILCGEYDLLTPPKLSKTMHEKILDSELHIIPGNFFNSGHSVYSAQPDIINKNLLRFLKKNFKNKPFIAQFSLINQ